MQPTADNFTKRKESNGWKHSPRTSNIYGKMLLFGDTTRLGSQGSQVDKKVTDAQSATIEGGGAGL